MGKVSVLRELWEFLRARKKWWLAPIFVFLIVFTSGSAIAPFIYTLF